ncbi:hypothetical protein ACSBR1_039312 [Camellia fascicularis]
MEQMNDHIRKLKLYLKWFEEVEEGHIKEKEKEKLCNTLESAERKCTEKENLAKEESEKLDAIECQRREKEAKVVAEKLQASLKEELEKAEQRKSVSEGIDFSDENARVVILVGIPFPNINDIHVAQKKKYNDTYKSSRNVLSGNEWYCHQAFRALNQAADEVGPQNHCPTQSTFPSSTRNRKRL